MPRPSPAEPFADVEALLRQGVENYGAGRLREAAAAFHEALWLDPSNEKARDYLKEMLGTPPAEIAGAPEEPLGSAWDDGPAAQASIVLGDDPSEPGVREHQSQPPVPVIEVEDDVRRQVAALLEEARSAAALGDSTGAMDRCDRLLRLDPSSADGQRLRQQAAETLIQMYESQLGGREAVPELAAHPDEIIWLGLDHRAGFVLAQIDGQVSYDDLYAICGMSRLDTSRILSQLASQKVIRTRRLTAGARSW